MFLTSYPYLLSMHAYASVRAGSYIPDSEQITVFLEENLSVYVVEVLHRHNWIWGGTHLVFSK